MKAVIGWPVVALMMLGAGVALAGDLKDDVESGNTLADSCKKHPKVFNDLYTSLVQAGEIGGILDTILQRLASYLEKSAELARKIKGAMIYPACIISAAIIVTLVYFRMTLRAERAKGQR